MNGLTLDLKAALQPCIYYVLDEKKKPLYIGGSRNGLRRVFGPNPSIEAARSAAFLEGSHVTIVYFKTAREAFREEIKEIRHWNPKYNTCGVKGGREALRRLRPEQPIIKSDGCEIFSMYDLIFKTLDKHQEPLTMNELRKLVHPERYKRFGGYTEFYANYNDLVSSGFLFEAGKTQRSTKYQLSE